MHADFWVKRWEEGKIGFHRSEYNDYLVEYWSELGLDATATVLVPLSGKSLDMLWLSSQGHTVHGAELSKIAVEDFFHENNLDACLHEKGNFTHWQCGRNHIWHGDFFELATEDTGPIDAVFDRAALIALPVEMRAAYARHLQQLAKDAPILLVTLEYDQEKMDGPPFSVTDDEVGRLFGDKYSISRVCDHDVLSMPANERFRQRGLSHMREKVFVLEPR